MAEVKASVTRTKMRSKYFGLMARVTEVNILAKSLTSGHRRLLKSYFSITKPRLGLFSQTFGHEAGAKTLALIPD